MFNSERATAGKQNVLQKFWKLLIFLAMKKLFLFIMNDIIILLAFKQCHPTNQELEVQTCL